MSISSGRILVYGDDDRQAVKDLKVAVNDFLVDKKLNVVTPPFDEIGDNYLRNQLKSGTDCIIILQPSETGSIDLERIIKSFKEYQRTLLLDTAFPAIFVWTRRPDKVQDNPDLIPWISRTFFIIEDPSKLLNSITEAYDARRRQLVNFSVKTLVAKLLDNHSAFQSEPKQMASGSYQAIVALQGPCFSEKLAFAQYLHQKYAPRSEEPFIYADFTHDSCEEVENRLNSVGKIGTIFMDIGSIEDNAELRSQVLSRIVESESSLRRSFVVKGLHILGIRNWDLQNYSRNNITWKIRSSSEHLGQSDIKDLVEYFCRLDFAPGYNVDTGIAIRKMQEIGGDRPFSNMDFLRTVLNWIIIEQEKATKQLRHELRQAPPLYTTTLKEEAEAERCSAKIMLINVPTLAERTGFAGEPTSILYAASVFIHKVKNGQYPEITLDDVYLSTLPGSSKQTLRKFENEVRKLRPSVTCLSTTTPASKLAIMMAQKIKKIVPECITILGGPHECRTGMRTAWYEPFIDFSVDGDGEYVLDFILNVVLEGRRTSTNPKALLVNDETKAKIIRLNGKARVYFRYQGDTQQLITSDSQLLLDKLPLMPKELLKQSQSCNFTPFKRNGQNARTAQVITRRGCPFNCSFCAESYTPNQRSIQHVKHELEHLKEIGYEAIFFDDSTFTDLTSTRTGSREERREFLRHLYSELVEGNWEWGCQTRVDQLNEATIEQMEKAGCSYVFLGVESAVNSLLSDMIKGTSRDRIVQTLDLLQNSNLNVGISLMFGPPELFKGGSRETFETAKDTIDLVADRIPYDNTMEVSINITNYYPQSMISQKSPVKIDFSYPIPNSDYPWSRFAEASGHHAGGIDAHLAEKIYRYACDRIGSYLLKGDINPRRSTHDCVPHFDFNYPEIIYSKYDQPRSAPISLGAGVYERVRKVIKSLWFAHCSGHSPSIILTRNRTESLGFALMLSGYYDRTADTALIVGIEPQTLHMPFKHLYDFGNPKGKDLWADYQPWSSYKYDAQPEILHTARDKMHFAIKGKMSSDHLLEELDNCLLRIPNVSVVFIPHVIAETGEIIDLGLVHECVKKRQSAAKLIIDGSYALLCGELPFLPDGTFYIAGVNKSLRTPPFGFCVLPSRISDAEANQFLGFKYPVLEGMLPQELTYGSYCPQDLSRPELEHFLSLEYLNNHDYASLCEYCNHKRDTLANAMKSVFRTESVHSSSKCASNIFSTRLIDTDQHALAENLWAEASVYTAYYGKYDCLRFCLDPDSSLTESAAKEFAKMVRDATLTLGYVHTY